MSLRSLVAVVAVSAAAAGLLLYLNKQAADNQVVASLEDDGAFVYSHCLSVANWNDERYLLVAVMVLEEEEVIDIESVSYSTDDANVVTARPVLVPGTPFLTIDVDRLQDDRFDYRGSEAELQVEDLPAQYRSGLATVAMLVKVTRDGELEPTEPALIVDELTYKTAAETIVRKVDIQQWVSRIPATDDAYCEAWERLG